MIFSTAFGKTTTLSVSGASTYTWSNSSSSSSIVVSPSVTTSYTVTGSDETSICNATRIITVTVAKCTGIESYTDNEAFHFYPNPVTNILNIESPVKTSIIIYDQSGKFIYEKSLQEGTNYINTSSLSSGIYLIKFKSGNEVKTFKFLKLE